MNKLSDNDPVNNPSHYTQGKVECIEAIEAALGVQGFISFLRGQVLKYNWRLGKKDLPVQDAEKAQWYGALLVKKLQEDAAVENCRCEDDVKAIPPTQGAALTEKKAQSYEHSNSSQANHSYNPTCGCDKCWRHRSGPEFSAEVARFYACRSTGNSKRVCTCATCVALRAPYRSQP